MASNPLLAFKAGRYERRAGTNFLDAVSTKGAILMYIEDGLLHFQWKNRETDEVKEVRSCLPVFSFNLTLTAGPYSFFSRCVVLKGSRGSRRQDLCSEIHVVKRKAFRK